MQLIDQFDWGEKNNYPRTFSIQADPTKQCSSNRKIFMRMENTIKGELRVYKIKLYYI